MGIGALVEGVSSLLGAGTGQPNETTPTLEIEELGGQRRVIVLQGRALPYPPIALGVRQRVVTTWLPGYSRATATVLGAEDDNTSLNGRWKDKYLMKPAAPPPVGAAGAAVSGALQAVTAVSGALTGGFGESGDFTAPMTSSGEPVASLQDAVRLFDSVCREGQELFVTWGPERRVGHLVRFVPTYDTLHDADWEVEFEWTGRDEKFEPGTFAADVTAQSTFEELAGIVSDLEAILAEGGAITEALDDVVTSSLQSIVSLVETLGSGLATVNALVNLPANTVRRTIATLTSMVAASQEMADAFDLVPFSAQSRTAERADRFRGPAVSSVALAVTAPGAMPGRVTTFEFQRRVTFTQTLQRAAQARRIQAVARRLRATAAIRRAQLSKQFNSDIEAVYTARAGQDLKDVSMGVYHTRDQWIRLMVFNELSTSVLYPGQVILCPRTDVDIEL